MDSGLLGEGVENYRGFRYNWTGIPNEAPAIVALKDEEEERTKIYVSWNGDTETKTWRFYEVNESGRRSFLGQSKRKGFETVLRLDHTGIKTVQAEAFDAKGKLLINTSVVKPDILIQQFHGKKNTVAEKSKTGLVPWLFFEGQKLFRFADL
jgi:hypothetical protein